MRSSVKQVLKPRLVDPVRTPGIRDNSRGFSFEIRHRSHTAMSATGGRAAGRSVVSEGFSEVRPSAALQLEREAGEEVDGVHPLEVRRVEPPGLGFLRQLKTLRPENARDIVVATCVGA